MHHSVQKYIISASQITLLTGLLQAGLLLQILKDSKYVNYRYISITKFNILYSSTISYYEKICQQVETDNGCSILHITDVKSEDEGPVTCIAHVCINGGTPVTISCSSSLCIDSEYMGSPATIIQGPADISTLVGETVILEAAFTGQPKPRVQWLKAVIYFE